MALSFIGLVRVNLPVDGLYTSAVPLPLPPAIRTLPLGSRLAVCRARASVIDPVRAKAPVAGSKISAVAQGRPEATPPAIRTRPSFNSVAVAKLRLPFINAEAWNLPIRGVALGTAVGKVKALGLAVGAAVGLGVGVGPQPMIASASTMAAPMNADLDRVRRSALLRFELLTSAAYRG